MNEHLLPNVGWADNPRLTGKLISGAAIAKRVKKTPKAMRSPLAAAFARGDVALTAPTAAQTALLFDLSVNNVSLVKNATAAELAALRAGSLSLNSLRAKRRKPPVVPKTAAEIQQLVDRLGVDAVKGVFAQLSNPRLFRAQVEIENFLGRCNPADVASILNQHAAPAMAAE